MRRASVRLARRLLSLRLAVALGILVFALIIVSLVLVALAGQSAAQLIGLMTVLPVAAIGTLVAARRPGNPLGWLMLGAGLLFTVNDGAVAYSILDYRLHQGTLPLGRVAIALEPAWAGGLVLLTGFLWLFPDGHLPSGRWRRVGGTLFWAGLVYAALAFVPSVIAACAQPLSVTADGTPAALDELTGPFLIWAIFDNIGFFALLISWVAWLVVQVPKYRKSNAERRLQFKWLYSGIVVFIISLTVTLLQGNSPSPGWRVISTVAAVGLAALPLAVGIGILKFRLYEIDRIISRTVSYALVTGLIIGVYVGVVTLATKVLPFPGSVGVAASTLIAAVLFNPLRKRIQRIVDRRFNRAHYDAEATVAAFAGLLRGSVDLPSMERELTAAVHQAFEPVHVSVWLTDR